MIGTDMGLTTKNAKSTKKEGAGDAAALFVVMISGA
jgi:hypothetical protein